MCLVADDSIFLAVATAHLSKTSHVMPLFPGLGKKGIQYLQRASATNNFAMDRIEYLRKKDMLLNLQGPLQRKVNYLIFKSAQSFEFKKLHGLIMMSAISSRPFLLSYISLS